jgi:hypothetical protein
MITTWSEIRPGDIVIMNGQRYGIKAYNVSTGTFTLANKNGQEYPGRPRLDGEVRRATAQQIVEMELGAQEICPHCKRAYP